MIQRLKESSFAIAFLIVIVGICFLFNLTPFNSSLFFNFLFCSVLVVIGQTIFLQGADNSLILVGSHCGSSLMKIGKVWLILLFGFIVGFITTIAEPDVQVLADLIASSNLTRIIFILAVGLGVGTFTLVAYTRILKNIPVNYVLIALYALIFILSIFSDKSFVILAFDSSGVTTGAITVPFLLSLTIGICHVRTVNKKEDNFGVIAIATCGTIIGVLIMSYFLPVENIVLSVSVQDFWSTLQGATVEILIALLPLFLLFIIMQLAYFKFPLKYFLKIIMGYLLSGLGLIMFVTGVLFGFAPLGEYFGLTTSSDIMIYILSACFGIMLVFTEPSIKVLLTETEEVSNGLIKRKYVYLALCLSVLVALVIATLRIYLNFDFLWLIIPLVVIALGLTFFTPKIFYTLAFDSGTIVTGTILASFVTPFYIGLSTRLYGTGNNALGMIAVVTFLPVIAIEILGIIYNIYEKRHVKKLQESLPSENVASTQSNSATSPQTENIVTPQTEIQNNETAQIQQSPQIEKEKEQK